MDNSPNTLSVVEEEATNVTDIDDAFPPHVDTSNIVIQPESPTSKKQTLKTFAEVNTLLQAGRKREVKLIIRENAWPLNNGIRTQLWPALCDGGMRLEPLFLRIPLDAMAASVLV